MCLLLVSPIFSLPRSTQVSKPRRKEVFAEAAKKTSYVAPPFLPSEHGPVGVAAATDQKMTVAPAAGQSGASARGASDRRSRVDVVCRTFCSSRTPGAGPGVIEIAGVFTASSGNPASACYRVASLPCPPQPSVGVSLTIPRVCDSFLCVPFACPEPSVAASASVALACLILASPPGFH